MNTTPTTPGTPGGPAASATEPDTATTAHASAADARPSFWSGRSELLMPVLVLALAVWLTVETATMHVMGTSVPGPQFFPALVCGLLYLVAIVHALQVLRHPRPVDPTDDAENADMSADMLGDLADATERGRRRIAGQNPGTTLPPGWRTYTDWPTVAMVVGGLAAFILVLPWLGWVLSAAGLFWIVARALGSRRPLFDLSVGLVFSSIIQLAFNAGLGLNLPSGFLEGVL